MADVKAEIKELGDKIVALSLLDAQALSTYLKDTYGIEAAAGGAVMMAAPAGGGAAAAPAEGESYSQKVVFEVARDANKIEIRRAVQDLFKVTVTDVRTVVVRGKVKRVGRFSGQRPSWKKAFVTLKPGDDISFFEGV